MSWKARIEFVSPGTSTEGIAKIFAVQTLTGSGTTVVSTDAAPTFGSVGRGQARITMLSGAVLIAINDTTPVEADSVRAAAGQEPLIFSIAQGQVLSITEAADGSADEAPARGAVKLTKGPTPLTGGPCRALLVGTPGTANITDALGNSCTNIPLQAGYNPISITVLAASGTADDIWALY